MLSSSQPRYLLEKLTRFPEQKHKNFQEDIQFGIPTDESFCVLILNFSERTNKELLIVETDELIRERFPHSEIICIEHEMIAILFSNLNIEELNIQIQILCEHLNQLGGDEHSIYGGISVVRTGTEYLHIAYQEASTTLRQGIHEMRVRRYEPQSLYDFMKAVSYNPECILHNLRAKDYDEVYMQIHQCFAHIERNSDANRMGFYIAMNILSNFSFYLLEQGINISDGLEDGKEILEKTNWLGHVQDIENELLKIIRNGIILLQQKCLPSTKKKAEDARNFIEKNYTRSDMGLNLVAETIKVNPSYLSNIFKNEFGCTLSRYIMQKRLNYAREMMQQNPSLTVTSLAEEIGYSDTYYFSKSFKTLFGISPSKYMEERAQ